MSMRGIRLMGLVAGLCALIGTGSAAGAQVFPGMPPQPLMQISVDPSWGPICAGIPEPGFGAAPCEMVQKELDVRARMGPILGQLQQIGFQPPFGPICNGPLGPGPCLQVARWISMQQVAQQQLPPLIPIGNIPGVGPVCAGPLGPGPCEAVRMYLAQTAIGGTPNAFDLRQVQTAGTMGGSFGPTCNGPFGPVPCALVGQFGLDRIGAGMIPPQSSFGLPSITDPTRLAGECARRSGLDLGAFVGCTGQRVILPARQQAILDCAVSSPTAQTFGGCAAQASGIRLSEDQQVLANCAMRAKGQAAEFVGCAGGAFANRALDAREKAVLACAASPGQTAASFVACATPRFLEGEQRAVFDCAVSASDVTSFATCAAPNASIKMSDDQRILARCAMSSRGNETDFATCAGSSFLQRGMGEKERAVLACAASSQGDGGTFAGCAAQTLLPANLSREQQIAVQCAVESGGDPASFGGCAAANMFSLQLNPEQQIAVQCVVGTGGAPPAAAGCIASRLTLRELTKCLSDGIGGKGCFGDSNDLVGKDGFMGRTLGQIAGGPHSLINNPGQIWGGDNSFVRNPGQIFGGPNSFVRNPGQIFGGSNSVFNNPGQLLPKPKPVQLGSIGGKRICLPWC
jgi:hypothetical protein